MALEFRHRGDFKKLEVFLQKMHKGVIFSRLDQLCSQGVAALREATPSESGATAASWDYEIKESKGSYRISWTNSNVNNGVNIALILQMGHGTGTGGYVQGRDYINPAMASVFDKIADAAWKVVTSA